MKDFCQEIVVTLPTKHSKIMQLTKFLPPASALVRTQLRAKWIRNILGTGRAEKYLRHAIEGGLGALIILLLASFWWPKAHPPAPAIPARQNMSVIPPPRDTADAIVAAHLFGQAQANATAIACPAASITVDGIVYASQSSGSEVALTVNGQSNVYRIGELLPDGEKVAAIDAASITLAADGTSRSLSISKYGDPGSEGPAAYAALLQGVGLSSPAGNTIAVGQGLSTQGGQIHNLGQSFVIRATTAPTGIVTPPANVVRVSARATPLEQLHSLRAQLIR